MTEDYVEQAALEWLATLGSQVGHGPDVLPLDPKTPCTKRDPYPEVIVKRRVR